MAIETYYYDNQFKRYITQFMYVFNGLHVMVGKNDVNNERLIQVPINYGSKDRVVQHILSGNTQNKPIRLPLMSAYMSGIEIDPNLMKGKMTQRKQTYLPRGGSIPEDITSVEQYMPIPYRMNMELSIYCSNQEQQFQILEQLLMIFDPTLQIQTSDSVFDWTKITTIKLENIRIEENYPPSIERRILQSSLDFSLPVWIAPPSTLKKEIVNKILFRLSTIDYNNNIEDIVAEFDSLNIPYETLIDSENL